MSETDRLTGLVGYSGVKVPVRAASTAALTLSGEQTVDGVALVTGDRVLVKDQASSIDNGIYVVDTGAWERAKDADGPYDFIQGSLVPVYGGTTYAATLWQQQTADPVPDTTALTFGAYITQASVSAFWLAILALTTASAASAAINAEALVAAGIITPTTLAANTDNWAPTGFATASMIRVSASAAYNLTGIAGGAAGRLIMLHNVGTFAITLVDDATSTASNRFQLSANYTLGADQSVLLEYDGTSSRWRIFGQQTASSTTVGNSTQNFRLSLTSGLPVTTADVTAAGTLYAVPYTGKYIDLYDGASWNRRASAQFSLALVLTSGKPYDVFCYDNAGVPTLEVLVWTNDTTRATALAYQDGVLVKSGDATRRYMGTLYSSGANTTEDSLAKRYLWNYYNRVERECGGSFSTTRSTTSATFVEMNSEIRNQFVIGVAEDFVTARATGSVSTSGSGSRAGFGISLDGGTPEQGGGSDYLLAAANNGHDMPYSCALHRTVAAGFHYTTLFGSMGGGITLSFYSGTPTTISVQPTRLSTTIRG